MSFFQSSDAIKKNAMIWASNLPSSDRMRRNFFQVECLTTLTRLPQRRLIVGRYCSLLKENKLKSARIKQITEELTKLWQKFSFPILSRQVIHTRLNKLIKLHENNQRRPSEIFANDLENIFDITNIHGTWLCKEDKHLHQKQIESKGKVGYVLNKPAPASSVHPSKRPRISPVLHEPGTSSHDIELPSDTSDTESSITYSLSDTETSKRKKPSATKQATKLVTRLSLSTNKASKVCASLAEEGVTLPTPTSSGVWRGVIRDAENKVNKIKQLLKEECNFCLQFDGKRLSKIEYQVVCLTSVTREIKLGVVRCKSGSSQDVYDSIKTIIDDYDAWGVIKMIICDTTPVNTGKVNGVVIKLQNTITGLGFTKPQYIGCQHHILDRTLRHILDPFLTEKTTKPTLQYKFIDMLEENYEELKNDYKAESEEGVPVHRNPGWRDDFKFLFELCMAFQYFEKYGKFPVIKWKKLPSLHNARWNSRAIYTVIAYFLLPSWRRSLQKPARFIANAWQEAWFTDQKYSEVIYDRLSIAITGLECTSAHTCLKTHWVREPSLIDIPRSNMVAERAVKVMEELHGICKTDKYLHLRFVATNNI